MVGMVLNYAKMLGKTILIDGNDSANIAAFAKANGFSYDSTPKVYEYSSVGHAPAWVGPWGGVLAHQVNGKLFGYDTTMSVFYQATGVSSSTSVVFKNTSKLHFNKTSVVRIKLNKIFPQMLLDSNRNDSASGVSSVPSGIKDSQKISLEGNFDNYFDFYAPNNLNVHALTVLAPNFMSILMDSSVRFDVEFHGDEMIITSREPMYSPKAMQILHSALEQQLIYMKRLEFSWNYVPNTQPFDVLKKRWIGGPVIKIGSRRVSLYGMLIGAFLLVWTGGVIGIPLLLWITTIFISL